MKRPWFLLLIAALVVLPGTWTPESRGENPRFFAAPTTQLNGWRSRRTIRNGPILFGSVYRERVGNGWRPPPEYVSNNRLAFGTSVLQNAPQIITSLTPFFAPATAGDAATESDAAMSAAGAANSLPANAVLDALVDPAVRVERHRRLDATMADTRKILAAWNAKEIAPQNADTWGTLPDFGSGDDGNGGNGGGEVTVEPPPSTDDVKRLTVRFDPSLSLSDTDIDRVTAQMTRIVNAAQGTVGPQKLMKFERASSITSYQSLGFGAIQDVSQLKALQNANRDADVLVVRSLAYCNPNATGAGVIGCAGSNQNAQIVVEWQPGRSLFNAILWVHELCHNVDIGHVSGSPRRVMNLSLAESNTQLIAKETLALSRLTPEAAAGSAAVMSAAFTPCCDHEAATEGGPLAEETMGYDALLREERVHGFDWNALRNRYADRQAADAEIAQILAEVADNRGIWSLDTVCLLLCASGTSRGIGACQDYISENLMNPDEDVQGHVRAAMRALGRAAADAARDPASAEVDPKKIVDFVTSLMPADAQQAEALFQDGDHTKLSPKSLAAHAGTDPAAAPEIAVRATDTRLAGALALALAGSDSYKTYLETLELRDDTLDAGTDLPAVSARQMGYKMDLGESLGKIKSAATDQ